VRTRYVYRSGHLARATEADLSTLRSLGIRVVIDFRGDQEALDEGDDRLPTGAVLVRIPMFDLDGDDDIRRLVFTTPPERIHETFGDGRAFDRMKRAAAGFVTDETRAPLFAEMVRTILDAGGPVVVHCAAGKDRTGWAASLMLLALGVPDDTVIEHYLQSNRRRPEQHPRLAELERQGIDLAILRPLVEVDAAYKQSALDALQGRWGGIDGYLRDGLRVTADELSRFRDLMLVEGP
jgi:protein-tyrosine phosphatase